MEEKNKKIMIGAIIVVAIVVIAAVAVALTQNNDGGVAAYKEGDMITIATSPDFAPYDDLIGDKYSGIDMDVVRIVMYNLGWEEGKNYQFQTVTFGAIVLGVTQGKYTMGASGFTQTADRMNNVLFSDDYAMTNQCVVALKTTTDITADNLKTKTIAVQTGTTGDTIARANYAMDDAQSNIKSLDTYSDTVAQVQNKTADCIIVDHETALGMVAKAKSQAADKQLEIKESVKLVGVNEYYCFVFAKSNTQLCMAITTVLRDVKATGVIDDIIEYYADNENASGTASYWDSHNLSDHKVCNYKYADFA